MPGLTTVQTKAKPPARTAGRGRPRIVSEQERRQQVLTAAESVFLSAGYHTTTMDDVARAAGMSKRTVYQVVSSKAELFEALLTDRFLPITVLVEDDDRPLGDRLIEVLTRMANFCLAPTQIAMTRLMIAEALQSRDMADALERLGIGRGNGVLELWLAAQVDRGLLHPAPPPEASNALFFTAVGEALLHTLLSIDDPPPPAVLAKRIAYAVRLFLLAAAPDQVR